MKKSRMTLGLLFSLALVLGIPSWGLGEGPELYYLYMKNGDSLRCDAVWKGMGDYVFCSKSRGSQGYPESEVDMRRTFDVQAAVNRLVDKSLAEFKKGNWNQVIDAASAAIVMEPTNEVAYTNRAGAYDNLGKYQEAIKDCNEAIKINPGFGLAYNNRGYALERMGRFEQALADYDISCRVADSLGCSNYERLNFARQYVKGE